MMGRMGTVLRARAREIAAIVGADIQPVQNLRVLKKYKDDLKGTDEQKNAWAKHWIDSGFHGNDGAGLEQRRWRMKGREDGRFGSHVEGNCWKVQCGRYCDSGGFVRGSSGCKCTQVSGGLDFAAENQSFEADLEWI